MILTFKQKRITLQMSIYLFITGLLLLPIYIDFMGTLSRIISFDTQITTYIYYGVLWLLLILSFPKMFQTWTNNVIVGIIFFAFFVATQYFIFPQNQVFLRFPNFMEAVTFSPKTLQAVVPYIFIGLAATDMEQLSEYLHSGARIGVSLGAISYLLAIISGINIHYDDMSNAYALCTMVCFLIANYQKRDMLYIVICMLCLLLAGTRGPLLCAIVAIIIKVVLLDTKWTEKLAKALVGMLAIVFLQSDLAIGLVNMIEKAFNMLGVTKLRIVDYFREGMLLDPSGRGGIAETVFTKIFENPLFGLGVGGDRIAIGDNRYAHNLILEMWVSYGLVIGTAILAWMGYWIIRTLNSSNKICKHIGVAFFCSIIIKLFLSSSYLYSKELFLFLGICIASCKGQKTVEWYRGVMHGKDTKYS